MAANEDAKHHPDTPRGLNSLSLYNQSVQIHFTGKGTKAQKTE